MSKKQGKRPKAKPSTDSNQGAKKGAKKGARGASRSASADPLDAPRAEPLADSDLPRCSIVVLNWNGKHHLDGCFNSLDELDYPKDLREVILVDNGSKDGSQAYVAKKYSWVRCIQNERNLGFSAGCNQGMRNADRPEVVVFLNNDLRVEPGFLRALVAPVVQGHCAASTGKMLHWDGSSIDSAGGGANFHGIGIQRGYRESDSPVFNTPRKTLFACGGAMAMDAKIFDEVGGFDEDFFAYYEDVDLGWRTWLMGHEVHYTPEAVCYHHHSSTSARVPVERLRKLQIRNPLLACFKNYDDENLRRVLPAMLALASRRAFIHLGPLDRGEYRIEDLEDLAGRGWFSQLKTRWRNKRNRQTLDRVGVADLMAIDDFTGGWDHWMARRKSVQDRRQRPDSEILPLFQKPLWCIEGDPAYRALHEGLVDFLGLGDMFSGLESMRDEPRK